MTRSSRTQQHAVRSLTALLLLALASACQGDDPVRPQVAFDLRGVWDIRDTMLLEFTGPGGRRDEWNQVRHGAVTITPLGNNQFSVVGTVADSLCVGSPCQFRVALSPLVDDVLFTNRGDLSSMMLVTPSVPASAVSDSGVHWIEIGDANPASSCSIRLDFLSAAPTNRSCRLAMHWRRRPPTR